MPSNIKVVTVTPTTMAQSVKTVVRVLSLVQSSPLMEIAFLNPVISLTVAVGVVVKAVYLGDGMRHGAWATQLRTVMSLPMIILARSIRLILATRTPVPSLMI